MDRNKIRKLLYDHKLGTVQRDLESRLDSLKSINPETARQRNERNNTIQEIYRLATEYVAIAGKKYHYGR